MSQQSVEPIVANVLDFCVQVNDASLRSIASENLTIVRSNKCSSYYLKSFLEVASERCTQSSGDR